MTHLRHFLAATCAVVLAGATASRTRAQELQLADRGPRFLSAPTATMPAADATNAPVFRRRVSLELVRVRLGAALAEVTQQAGVRFAWATGDVPVDRLVSLSATDITLAAALHELLLDTELDVQLSTNGLVSLVRHGTPSTTSKRQGQGTIAGRAVDAMTRAPLDQVAVRVEGLALGAVTTSDGRYAIHTVPTGTYRLVARRVGYAPLTQTIMVGTDSVATADFALAAAPTRLNEMVTTAVGDQRRYEVGNTISTINADSIAPTAPITSLTDLVSARAPGVEVLETSGMTGTGETIRIRGLSSLVLQNDPILIVDGVRQDNAAGGDVGAYFSVGFGGSNGTHPSPTRLNDIDFNDVESIDVLKGPSASTEYGTDAANGVIVITTKHGTAGRPQWRISAEQTASGIPEHFPDGYYSWGHTTDGTHQAVDCPLVSGAGISVPYASTAGNCAVDSVTRENPFNHAATTIFGTGSRSKYDLSVSGGSEAIRYFVAGGLSNERGIVQMPPVFRQLADTAGVALPSSALNPNSEQQRSVRVNTAIKLGPTADLTATGSYLSTYQQTPETGFLYYSVFLAPALGGPAHYYGYGWYLGNSSIFTPLSELTTLGSQNTNRVTGGLSTNWRPTGWFVGHATVGLDHGSQRNEMLTYPLGNPAYQVVYSPFLGLVDGTTDVYSVDLRGTATAALTHGVRAVTSGGVQIVDNRLVGQSGYATGITATNLTLNGATGPTVTQIANRQATLGGYGEEQISVADRLFVTGAVRIDAGSAFGRNYATAVYPKASVSWLALDERGTTVRARAAFGESGVQPTNGAASTLYAASVAYMGGTTVTTYPLNWPGNPNLRPERSVEFEGGVDLAAWGNRVNVELTGYSKTTRDALVNADLGATLGGYLYQKNIGTVRNTGAEGTVTLGLVQSRSVTWDVGVNGSINHNTLISLAPGVPDQLVSQGIFSYRQAPGYPLYGIWMRQVTYADANHDGIIEPSEVTVADSATYMAPSLPTREASVSTHLGLWRGTVTVAGLVDYRGGYRIVNGAAESADSPGANTRGTNDPKAPLWLQARAVTNSAPPFISPLDVEDGSFMRIREVSVTYAVPRAVVRALHVQSLGVTGAVRNLSLWTHYTGIDPEVSNTYGTNVQASPTSSGYMLNNDVRWDYGAVPLLRYWVVRLNVGL